MFYRVSLFWDVLSSSPGLWVWGGDPRSTEPSSHHMGPVPSTRLVSMMPTLVVSQVVSVGCLHWEPPSFLPSPRHVFSLKESLVRPPLQGSSGVGAAPLGGSFCVETCLLSHVIYSVFYQCGLLHTSTSVLVLGGSVFCL